MEDKILCDKYCKRFSNAFSKKRSWQTKISRFNTRSHFDQRLIASTGHHVEQHRVH